MPGVLKGKEEKGMLTPQIYDLIVLSLGSYFLLNYLYRKEAAEKNIDNQKRRLEGRNNAYFLLTMLVCVCALTAIELFVPYGCIAMLVLAVCGLCGILMDLMYFVLICRMKKCSAVKDQACHEKKGCCDAVPPEAREPQKKDVDVYKKFY